jgi:Zn-dependent protease
MATTLASVAAKPATASIRSARQLGHRGWSWPIGRLAGIELRVHATLLLLLGWVGAQPLWRGQAARALAEVGFVVALFASIVAHELGHALVARRFGIATPDITLLPIGGVARLEHLPERPQGELAVAAAGPIVSALLFIGLALLGAATAGRAFSDPSAPGMAPVVSRLAAANLMLALFNLIPAYPMDGGRVLRALLALRLPRPEATRIAVGIGQGLAAVVGLVGLFVSPMLLLVAAFVWVAATAEGQEVDSARKPDRLIGPRRNPCAPGLRPAANVGPV